MKRRLILPIATAVLCLAAPATAQMPAQAPVRQTVSGTITDASTGAPLAGASVEFERSHKTVWTDEHGRFALAKVHLGEERLRVEQLGYKDGELTFQVEQGLAPLSLALQPNPVLLEGLAVVARRLRSRPEAMLMSVRNFESRDLQLSGSWSVADFLRSRGAFIPVPCHYAFSSGCVWSRGQLVPMRVFLDDMRLFGGLDELETIPVTDLYRVEVYQRGTFVQLLTRQWALRAAQHAGRSGAFFPPFF